MTLLELSHEYRQKLLSMDAESAARIIRRYQEAYSVFSDLLSRWIVDLEAKRQKRQILSESPSWVAKQERFQVLLQGTREQLDRFGEKAAEVIATGQEKTIELGIEASTKMAEAGMRQARVVTTFDRLPVEAFEHLVGNMGDGTPLAETFARLGPVAEETVKSTLSQAVLKGENPRRTATKLRESLGGSLTRSLTIARTEQIRPHRQAALENYRANSKVIEGWYRYETLDDRTCIICIALHGTFHTLEEDFEGHPNCRGTSIPKVVGVERKIELGTEWFDKQPEEFQREALGRDKFKAYQVKEIDLHSLVEKTYSDQWGGGYRQRSLEEAKKDFRNRTGKT